MVDPQTTSMTGEMPRVRVLLGGSLIDGTGRDPVPDAAVVIKGDRIAYAGPRAEAQHPDHAAVHDVTGMTVLPGLIDCHDHLAHTGLDLNRRAVMPPGYVYFEQAYSMEQTLLAGITALRDAGGLDAGAKKAQQDGILKGPRLVVSISLLCPTAGLGDFRPPSGLTFPDECGRPRNRRNGVDDCRLGVREMVAAGADAIKIATTGGVGSERRGPLDRQFTDEEVFTLVDEAHAWGKKVLAHAHGGEGARQAVQAGADSIDHGTFLYRSPELLEEMADRGLFLVPTLSIVADHLQLGPPTFRARAGNLMDECRRTIERAQELGVKMAMGTDAGAYGHARNAREIRFLIEAGVSPMKALVMSTSAAAECIGLQDTIGSLEAGKLADLLVVDGDPLRDIGLIERSERLQMVMQGGTAYVDRLTRSTLSTPPPLQSEVCST